MIDKILIVDDEPAVLEGYRRSLRRFYSPDIANAGDEGLSLIAKNGPYAVVVSDMRMPGMDGVRFLSEVSKFAPDTVRIILTGYADFQAAMEAVNVGKVFRFLTKPCEGPLLRQTLAASIEQYHLVVAERELLQKTLVGCIEALTGVLSMANPITYSRSVRIRRYAQQLTTEMHLRHTWKCEMAALLSQLGCVTLTPEVLTLMQRGEDLSSSQRATWEKHPLATRKLLEQIPRLEEIAWMIAQQCLPFGTYDSAVSEQLMIGAEILRVAIAFDGLRSRGMRDTDAKKRLKTDKRIHPEVLQAIDCLHFDVGETELRTLRVSELSAGMILQEDVRTDAGILIVVRGQELTEALIVCLGNFQHQGVIRDTILVQCPCPQEVGV